MAELDLVEHGLYLGKLGRQPRPHAGGELRVIEQRLEALAGTLKVRLAAL
jgi:hypothetical protein